MNAQAKTVVNQALSRAQGFQRVTKPVAPQATPHIADHPKTWHGSPANLATHAGVDGEPMCRTCIREYDRLARFEGDDPVAAGWVEELGRECGFLGDFYPRLLAGVRIECRWCVGG